MSSQEYNGHTFTATLPLNTFQYGTDYISKIERIVIYMKESTVQKSGLNFGWFLLTFSCEFRLVIIIFNV